MLNYASLVVSYMNFFAFNILSLLAKLDKADRAFCFTSGMAALAAVSRLVKAGKMKHTLYLFNTMPTSNLVQYCYSSHINSY